MRLGVSECEGAAPGAAKHQPPLYSKVRAYLLDIGDEMPGSVVFKRGVRLALSRAALIKKNYVVSGRVEEATIVRHKTCAWSTVEKDDGLPFWIATLLVVEFMNGRNLQTSSVERLNLGVQVSKFAHTDPLWSKVESPKSNVGYEVSTTTRQRGGSLDFRCRLRPYYRIPTMTLLLIAPRTLTLTKTSPAASPSGNLMFTCVYQSRVVTLPTYSTVSG